MCRLIKGPDFPTGGQIVGLAGIDSYLRTGRGIVRMRGKAHTEEMKNGGEQIVVTEIPYNVNRATLVTRIAELVNDKLLDGIRDLRDESDENTRIVIELKRGEQSKVVINQLFQKTALESSFGVTLLAIDKKRPKQMNIKELIECYVDHRRDVLTRRTRHRLKQAEDRAHILEGYKIALDNLDDFVRIIRASANRDEARTKLDGAVSAHRTADQRDPRPPPLPTHRTRARKDRGRIPRVDEASSRNCARSSPATTSCVRW